MPAKSHFLENKFSPLWCKQMALPPHSTLTTLPEWIWKSVNVEITNTFCLGSLLFKCIGFFNSLICVSCSLRLYIPCVQTIGHRLQDHVLARICQQLHQPHHLPMLQPGVQESFPKFTGSSLPQSSPKVTATSSENSSKSNSGSQPDFQLGPWQQGGRVPPKSFLVHGPVPIAVLQGQQGVEGLFRRRNGRIGTRPGK